MRRLARLAAIAVLAAPVGISAQPPDASKILADTRQALGGGKLDQVQSLAIEGRSTTVTPAGARTTEFEMALQLPDKYMRRDVLAAMGNMSVYRVSGFNGPDGLINEIDRPPQLAGGGGRVLIGTGPSNPAAMGADLTPEQREEQRRGLLLSTRQEYARLALGLFGAAPAVYPLEFSYAGEAESPDGTAHVLDVKGEGDFAARLFIDTKTHLPLMLTWMDKEPLQMTMGGGMAGMGGGGRGGMVVQGGGGMSAADLEKLKQEVAERMKEAEANRRVVEFHVYYGDFKTVSGVKLPHRLQFSIDGEPSREMQFDRVRVNARIDQRKFQVTK
jgi:hypothetical protein